MPTIATVVSVQWFGSEALELTYKTASGKVANELLYRDDEHRLELVEQGRPWSFDGDGALFRLVSEAQRIRLAHLFDPVLAAGGGTELSNERLIAAIVDLLLPCTTVLTPNSVEARKLSGLDDLDDCGLALLEQGCDYVLITGTHEDTPSVSNQLFHDDRCWDPC